MLRTFKVGVRTIPAPLPNGTLDENVRHLMKTYPQFRWTSVLESDGRIQPYGSIQYELILPPTKVNG